MRVLIQHMAKGDLTWQHAKSLDNDLAIRKGKVSIDCVSY